MENKYGEEKWHRGRDLVPLLAMMMVKLPPSQWLTFTLALCLLYLIATERK
jgi:hypothetical protein